MAFREVSVVQINGALRRWLKGEGERPIAHGIGIDRKTARRYISAAIELGLDRSGGEEQLTDELIDAFLEYAQARGLVIDAAHVATPTDKGLASHCTSCRRFDQNSTFELASHAFHESRVIGPRWSVEPFVLVVRSEALEQTGLVPLLDGRRADREPLCHLAEVEKPASTQALGVAREMIAAA